MCGIFGYFGSNKRKDLKEETKKLLDRGPDSTRYYEDEHAFIGFNRLAIMGLDERGMQPFFNEEKVLVCNGEIYGFKKLKKSLDFPFVSESDCEILLPLYKKMGVEMFHMLDSEFALIMYDKETHEVMAARDPIGIRPLFYGEENGKIIAFASEAKALSSLCDTVMPFPIGSYYKDGVFVRYTDIAAPKLYHFDTMDETTQKIRTLLTKGVEKRLVSDAKVGFLLSGGLDSSLICSIAQKQTNTPILTYSIGMDKDAIDLKYAREVADYLGTIHTEIIITKDDVLNALRDVIYTLETYDITTIRASIGMYLLCKGIKKNSDIKVLLTGEISDELFGYKYTDFAPDSLAFQEESQKRIRELYMYDCLRADRCISRFHMESRVPFGDLDFVDYVMSIDPEMKMNHYNKGKYLLRKAFEGDYLPYDILYREKAAFSDAVGHSMVDDLKDYANQFYTDEEYQEKRSHYSFAQPFTKESLLYREIFESFYQGRAEMVSGFWMPNKKWDHCDVDDPSARVLANYGDSGK